MAILSTDPIGFPLDEDGDLDVEAFQASGMASGTQAVADGIRARVLLIRGEWFLDESAGVPYFERAGVLERDALIGGRYDAGRVIEEIRAAILSTPGVKRVDSITSDFDARTRTIAITYAVTCDFGDVVSDTLDLGAIL